jgi:hypothetical protein
MSLIINSDWVDAKIETDKKIYLSVDRLSHNSNCDKNILLLAEPFGMSNILEKNIVNNYKNWDYIFTWNEKILNLPNTVYFEFGGCWIPKDREILNKDNLCTIICGDKKILPGHLKRIEIFKSLLHDSRVKKFASKKSSLAKLISNSLLEIDDVRVERIDAFKSKFHIAIENCSEKSYFTEKIIDCFITRTIPIYWGCPNIGDFFNKNGILLINDFKNINEIIDYISNINYNDYLYFIEENYQKALIYRNFNARLIEKILPLI